MSPKGCLRKRHKIIEKRIQKEKQCDLADDSLKFDSLSLDSSDDILKLKLIDFANVYIPCASSQDPSSDPHTLSPAPDEDLMQGIQKIIGLLEELLRTPNLLDDYDLDTETSSSGKK
jgi:hypothetical protein